MNEDFPKSCRILSKRDFNKVLKKGERKIGKFLFIEVERLPEGKIRSRLGITVTKKFGKAHDRNRFKRLVRESFRLLKKLLLQPIDCVVKPKGTFLVDSSHMKMSIIYQDMYHSLREYLQPRS